MCLGTRLATETRPIYSGPLCTHAHLCVIVICSMEAIQIKGITYLTLTTGSRN